MSNTEDHKELGVYELGYLILPSVAEDQLPDVVNSIKEIIKKAGGSELDSEDPTKIDLAYTMHKVVGARKYVVDDAFIGWVKFESEPAVAPQVSEAVQKLDEVLRFLLVKAERETYFTFAEARRKQEEREQALAEAAKAAETGGEKVVE